MQHASPPRSVGADLWLRLEHACDALCGSAANPLRHLGPLAFLSFWLLAVTGAILYAALDTSATGAYASITDLSRQPWYQGGWLRSLHRYAADAFIVLMLAHLVREWMLGRFRAFRRFSWLTGLPLLPMGLVCAIGGFWLHWDRLGQFSALASAEWLDALPLFATPLTRNFIHVENVSDRLFSLLVFVHIGVPLLAVFASWFHIQRLAQAAVFPPRAATLALTASLVAASILLPVPIQGAADLASMPASLSFDWWLLFLHPATEATSAPFTWGVTAVVLAALFALPWLPTRQRTAPVARVDAANCNGCRRCFDDCPYAAVTMAPHPQRQAREIAVVNADQCASCGICVGACPSSTPFRSVAELVTGIDMPSRPLDTLRVELNDKLAALGHGPRLVVVGCERGAEVGSLASDEVAVLSLTCTGMLPPAFVEYALRAGADGVLVTGCRDGGCEFRLGSRWTAERLEGRREPHLRTQVPRERLATVWADAGQLSSVNAALTELRERVAALPARAQETA